jgi:hypothetical protein
MAGSRHWNDEEEYCYQIENPRANPLEETQPPVTSDNHDIDVESTLLKISNKSQSASVHLTLTKSLLSFLSGRSKNTNSYSLVFQDHPHVLSPTLKTNMDIADPFTFYE